MENKKPQQFNISLSEILKLNKTLTYPTDDLIDTIEYYKSKDTYTSLLIEYDDYFYLLKLIFKNEHQSYTQATLIFSKINGMKFDPNGGYNIFIVESIWESNLSDVKYSKHETHLKNDKTVYLEDIANYNHYNLLFIFPNQQSVFLKYHYRIKKCNIRTLPIDNPQLNYKKNHVIILDIESWMDIKFDQIFIYSNQFIGTNSSGQCLFQLPWDELFNKRTIFKKFTITECLGNFSKWGNLRDYHISIKDGFIIIHHTYDYYQNDNPRNYELIDRIKIVDILSFIK